MGVSSCLDLVSNIVNAIKCYIFFPVKKKVKNPPAMQETLVWFLGWEDPWRRDRLPIPVFLGFPGGSDSKESACDIGDLGWIPGLARSPGGGVTVHGVTESTQHIPKRDIN